jgi:hypothetical protein
VNLCLIMNRLAARKIKMRASNAQRLISTPLSGMTVLL